jgi:hypothetical protein
MAKETGKKLPVWKRVGGFALLGLVLVAGFALELWQSGMLSPSGDAMPVDEAANRRGMVVIIVITLVLGAFFLGAGLAAHVMTLSSRCFTSDFTKPFWDGLKGRLQGMNFAVLTLGCMGAANRGLLAWLEVLLLPGPPVGMLVVKIAGWARQDTG